jgi:hypothetical protein
LIVKYSYEWTFADPNSINCHEPMRTREVLVGIDPAINPRGLTERNFYRGPILSGASAGITGLGHDPGREWPKRTNKATRPHPASPTPERLLSSARSALASTMETRV